MDKDLALKAIILNISALADLGTLVVSGGWESVL